MIYELKFFKGSPSGEIIEASAQKPVLTRDQVYLDVTHSGVCGTDGHYQHADVALGHEGVGVVKATGPEVKDLKM